MGFERLVSVLQDKRSNYDTDVFTPLFSKISQLTGAPPYAGKLGADDPDLQDTAYRVIADHIRTLSFAIADGAIPSNEGRGYVLRRILRRAVRYGRQMLGAKEGFFAALVPTVAHEFGEIFPELRTQQERVQAVIAEEESAFSSMLARGIKEFSSRAAAVDKAGGKVIDGEAAFFLYDTMGFPLDLTQLMAREAGLDVDVGGFEAQMAKQKARSAAAAQASKGGGTLTLGAEQTAFLANAGHAYTDDSDKYSWETPATPSTLQAIYSDADGFVDATAAADGDAGGGTVGLVLDRTPFYAEAGGQACDVGSILVGGEGDEAEVEFEVQRVQAFGGYVLHAGVVRKGQLSTGQSLRCAVDVARRKKVAPNHTLTHVLNAALLAVLGDGVDQKGSDVDEARMRFDFSHAKALKAAELEQVEALVRKAVADEQPVHAAVVPLAEAMQVGELRAVFGESYPDPVRVVTVGPSVADVLAAPDASWPSSSIELCGGTHISNTREAGDFALVAEEAVAKGVRRVIGLTGEAAAAALATGASLRSEVADWSVGGDEPTAEALEAARGELIRMRAAVDGSVVSAHLKVELRETLAARDKDVTKLLKGFAQRRIELAATGALEQAAAASAGGAQYVVVEVGALDGKALQSLVQKISKAEPTLAVLALSVDDAAGKVFSYAAVPQALQPTLPANEWLAETLTTINGRGGGKPASAQGSGAGTDAAAAATAAKARAETALAA